MYIMVLLVRIHITYATYVMSHKNMCDSHFSLLCRVINQHFFIILMITQHI